MKPMKKQYSPLALILLICGFVFCFEQQTSAQSYLWAKQGSSQGFEYGNAITSDDSGNVYVSGQIEYSSVFENVTLNSNGKHDILVGKYDTDGNLKWVKHAGGNGGDVSWGVGVDAEHNSYHTGEFETTAGFNPGDSLTVQGANDIFFTKYSSNGAFLWAKRMGGSGDDKGKAIAVDPNGMCYLTGYFSGNSNFGSLNVTSSGNSNDIYLAKANSDGTILWVRKAGGTKEDRGRGVAFDGSGNVFITGTITQSANFSGTNVSVLGKNSMFIAKYDTSGNFQWVRTAGGCCDTTRGNAIATDELGNAYVAGYFKDTTFFGANELVAEGSSDNFVVKYDPNGNVVWARRSGGPYEDMAYGCTYDARKNLLYITGQIDDHGYFGTVYVGARGNRDVFIAAYDTAGNVNWAKPGGGVQRDAGLAITSDTLNNIYTTGFFNDTAFFGNSTLQGYPLADFYVAKTSPSIATQPNVNTSAIQISSTNCGDMQLNFLAGNGYGRIVIAKQGSAVNSFPVDGNYYTANSLFGNGANLGSGSYVVYNGTGTSVTVTGLTMGLRYYFQIVEYNGIGYAANYLNVGNPTVNSISNGFSMNASASSPTICAGASTQLTASGAATYQWTPSTGLSSTTGSVVTANPAISTTYTVTGTNSGSCTAQALVIVSVTPVPVVTFGNLAPVCLTGGTVQLNQGSPAGGTYSGPGVSAGVFSPTTAGVGQHIITYQYSNGGCNGSDTSILVVNASPVVSQSAIGDVCSSAAPITLIGGSPLGGTYSGTSVSNGFFNPATAGVGVHSISYSYSDGNGCSSSASTNINVLAGPVVSLGSFSPVCSNSAFFALSGGSPSGGQYSGNGISNGNFFPVLAGTGNIPVNYTYTAGNGCSATATANIQVNPLPAVTIGNFSPTCLNTTPFNLSGGTPAGGYYSGTGVSGTTFNPSVAGAGFTTISYVFTDVNSCTNSAQTQISVTAPPTVTLSTFSATCVNGTPVLLSGGSPSGGTYSGTGVSNGYFNPQLGTGTYTINYSVSQNNCLGSASRPITVFPAPSVQLGVDSVVCANSTILINAGSGFSSVVWSTGEVGSSINVDSAGTGIGSRLISVVVTNTFGCQSSDTIQITFDPCSGMSQPVKENLGVFIYPNPFHGSFRILAEKVVNIYIYDMSGRVVEQQQNVNGYTDAGSNLAAGTYFVDVIYLDQRKTLKIIKTDR